MNFNDLTARVDQLIELGASVLATRHLDSDRIYEWIDSGAIKGFRAASLSFIQRVYGGSHPHYTEFNASTDGYYPEQAEMGMSILRAIRDEIAGGWLITLKGLVTAEVFSDFLDMADHLLSQGYKDAAAVIIGSVLEEHLRQLCLKHGIDTEVEIDGLMKPMKADRLNSELAKAEVYNKLDQKAVTAWIDLRNKAAHGNYTEYTREQVDIMLKGITEFLARVAI